MTLPRTVLVVGASHTMGQALVKEFLRYSEIRHVIGTSRHPAEHENLRKVKDKRFHYLKMDVGSDDSIKEAYKMAEEIVGDDGLNLIVNDQGVMMEYFFDEKPARNSFHHQMDVNAAAVLIITQTFLPLLEKAANLVRENRYSITRAAIVNISSTLGSIEKNNGEWREKNTLIFRVSKAALNAMTKDLSFELHGKGVLMVAICPGSMDGDLINGQRDKIEVSAEVLINTMKKLSEKDAGRFCDKYGNVIPY